MNKIVFSDSAQYKFELLKERSKISKKERIIFNSLINKVNLLQNDPEYGIHIPKNRIPKKYIENYRVTNLWKINLSLAWRMTYTIRGNEIEILSFIIDIFDHEEYDDVFEYKKR